MKALKILALVVIILVVLFFAIALVLPKDSTVARSIEIDAPAGKVFYVVTDFHQFSQWDPWSEIDPNAKITFNDIAYGPGSARSWAGNDQVGEGTMTLVDMKPNESATVALDFGDMGEGTSQYLVEDLGEKSKITWTFYTRHPNLPQRYFGLVIDSMLGKDYEKGLSSLKEYVESLPDIVTKDVSYELDGQTFTGYIAHPYGLVDPVPGVLVVHEWWGHNEHARDQAEKLAQEGFTALALDMYGDGKTASHPDDAMKFMQAVGANTQQTAERFDAAYELLQKHYFADATRIAAVGYCFGGSVAINMARAGKNLKGVVSFHGGLGNLVPVVDNAFTPILVLNGEDDPFVTTEQKSEFKKTMDAAGLKYDFVEYPGVVHSFTNKNADKFSEKFDMPVKYDPQADKDSWQRAIIFLNGVFYN